MGIPDSHGARLRLSRQLQLWREGLEGWFLRKSQYGALSDAYRPNTFDGIQIYIHIHRYIYVYTCICTFHSWYFITCYCSKQKLYHVCGSIAKSCPAARHGRGRPTTSQWLAVKPTWLATPWLRDSVTPWLRDSLQWALQHQTLGIQQLK